MTDWDEIIERINRRYERQLQLDEIYDGDDLESVLGGLPTGKHTQQKSTLESHSSDIFETRTIQSQVVTNIDRLKDLDKLQDLTRGNPEFRLVARQRGINLAKEQIRGKSIEDIPSDVADFLREHSPQTLGALIRVETQRLKREGAI